MRFLDYVYSGYSMRYRRRFTKEPAEYSGAQGVAKTTLTPPEENGPRHALPGDRKIRASELNQPRRRNDFLTRKTMQAEYEDDYRSKLVNIHDPEPQDTQQMLIQSNPAIHRALNSGSVSNEDGLNRSTQSKDVESDTSRRLDIVDGGNSIGASAIRQHIEVTQLNLQLLIKENEHLQKEVREKEEYASRLLHNALKDAKWIPFPDHTIRSHLEHLHSLTRHWAKSWVCEAFSFTNILPEQADSLRVLLSEFVKLERDGSLPPAVEWPDSKMKSKISSLLLTGALANLLQVEFFENPFFCLDPQHVTAMRELHGDLIAANPHQAHLWRRDVWRMLSSPSDLHMKAHDMSVSGKKTVRIRSLCDRILVNFSESPAGVLLATVNDVAAKQQRSNALREILMTAADVATSLWTQDSLISCTNMAGILERQWSFDISSPFMNAHPLNKVDREDAGNNGREILVVTRPTILAIDADDEEGVQSDRCRVLAKAIVWLEEPRSTGAFRESCIQQPRSHR